MADVACQVPPLRSGRASQITVGLRAIGIESACADQRKEVHGRRSGYQPHDRWFCATQLLKRARRISCPRLWPWFGSMLSISAERFGDDMVGLEPPRIAAGRERNGDYSGSP